MLIVMTLLGFKARGPFSVGSPKASSANTPADINSTRAGGDFGDHQPGAQMIALGGLLPAFPVSFSAGFATSLFELCSAGASPENNSGVTRDRPSVNPTTRPSRRISPARRQRRACQNHGSADTPQLDQHQSECGRRDDGKQNALDQKLPYQSEPRAAPSADL